MKYLIKKAKYDGKLLLKINANQGMEISQRPKWIALPADL